MRRVTGNSGVKRLECTHPVKDKWRMRWDVQTDAEGTTTYMEEEFDHHPTEEELRATVVAWSNDQTDEKILSGFSYEGEQVWLSSENQFNYKSAYDLAYQTNGATLPVKFKFGTDTEPRYHTFESLEELTTFYVATMKHVQNALTEGWERKDAFDIGEYQS